MILNSKNKPLGNCFEVAAKLLYSRTTGDSFFGKLYLVHAKVAGYGPILGQRHAHAWVEDDLLVYDFSNGHSDTGIILKKAYYSIGQINTSDPKKYHRYSRNEMIQKMHDTSNYGSWDIETDL